MILQVLFYHNHALTQEYTVDVASFEDASNYMRDHLVVEGHDDSVEAYLYADPKPWAKGDQPDLRDKKIETGNSIARVYTDGRVMSHGKLVRTDGSTNFLDELEKIQ